MIYGLPSGELFLFPTEKEPIHMQKKSIDYLLSLSLLKQLKSKNLITEEEFNKIDLLNKRSFNSP
jgi:hypothetical protein